ATAQNRVFRATAAARLGDRVGGAFLRVAEDRKQREAVSVVDGAVAQNTAHHVAAVNAQELVQFGSAEIKGLSLRPIILQGKDRRTLPAHQIRRRGLR